MEPVRGTLRMATCEKEVARLGKQHSKGRHTTASFLQLTSDSTRLFLRKTAHKAVFKKAPIQNYCHDTQTRSVKYMMTAYALNPTYLRWSPKVFTFPAPFKILTAHASYTVGDKKKGRWTLYLKTKHIIQDNLRLSNQKTKIRFLSWNYKRKLN